MTSEIHIPENLARTRIELHGEEGAEWVRRLPAILAECERRWSLRIVAPFPDLSYNYAASATRSDGTPVVLKVGYRSDDEFHTEMEALRLYAGRGAVELLDADLDLTAMLLEALQPGTRLRDEVEDDERATSIAASVMRRLWTPAPAEHAFPTVADWFEGFARFRGSFGGTSGPFPEALLSRAEGVFAELLSSMDEPVVLHGDLQHYNILAAERMPWMAIDPKGVVGEPTYETGALIRNPSPDVFSWPDLERVLARRIRQLSDELGFDRERIQGWAFAQAVLSACWTYEDHGYGWEGGMRLAGVLAEMED